MRKCCLVLSLVLPLFCAAQTGPGGVGTNDGSSSLELWLSVSDLQEVGYINGDGVHSWPDLSGNNTDATTALAGNYPTFSTNLLNGFPAVEFFRGATPLTTGDRLAGSFAVDADAPLSIVIVGYYNEISQEDNTGQFLVNVGPGGESGANTQASVSRQDFNEANPQGYYSYDGSVRRGSTTVINGQVWNAFMSTFATTSPFHSLFLNNATASVTDYTGALNGNSAFAIGSSSLSTVQTSYLNGRVAEVMVYSSVLNAAQRNIIFNYLSAKYNISISGDLYAGDLVANGDFDTSVAGIGQAASGTHTSSSSDGLNATIASGFSAGEYLMFGDRASFNSITSYDLSVNQGRWTRTWYVDVTTPDQVVVDLYFDFSESGVGGTPAVAGNYRLIRRNGSAWDEVATASSINATDRVVFDDVIFSQDGEYTIASFDLGVSPLSLSRISNVGSGPAGLSATTVGGVLSLWLDASQTTGVNGAGLSNWTDLSGNGFSATQSTALNQPIYLSASQNGLPVARFDGTNDFMVGALTNFDAPGTIAAAASFDNASQGAENDYIFDIGDELPAANASRASLSRRRNDETINRGNRFYTFAGLNVNDLHYGPVLNSGWNVLSSVYHTSAPFHQLVLNGSLVTSASGNASLNTSGVYNLGRWNSGGPNVNYLDGDIGEIVVFNTALNLAQTRILHAYLAAKWGLTIASDVYDGDIVGREHDFAVSGIGRTTNGEMENGYSAGLTLRLGASSANDSYVAFGHGSGTNSVITSDLSTASSTLVERLSRTWYLTVTGSIGTVSFQFDYSEMGITGSPQGDPSRFVLIQRAGTSGNWDIVAQGSAISSDQIFFMNVSLTNSGFYTLAVTSGSLPIQLSTFAAEVIDEGVQSTVQISWATLSEVDNDFFTVERSPDGIHWSAIAFEKSKSINGSGAFYSLVDRKPLWGTSYYRLKQTDFDGSFKYEGGVRVVRIDPGKIKFYCYPNPFDDQLAISTNAHLHESVVVQVIDVTGRSLSDELWDGEQPLSLRPIIEPGIYVVRVTGSNGIYAAMKVIKTR